MFGFLIIYFKFYSSLLLYTDKLLNSFKYFLKNYFIYLHSKSCSSSWSSPQSSSPYFPSLGHQVSIGLGSSSPIEARQSSSLLHICQGPWASPCMFFGCSHGSRLVGTVGFPMVVAITFSSFNPSSNSSIGVSNLSPMVGCNSLHLCQSASRRASQRTAMLGPCLKIGYAS